MGRDGTRPIEAPPPEQVDTLTRGALAGEYEIQSRIARGGGGTVYVAEHRVLRRRAAVKVLQQATPESIQRFLREARAVNLIKHPNIVDVYEYGQLADGRPFYVMEFLEGRTLDSLLREQGKLSPTSALPLLEPMCRAIGAAHAAGVVHRDVKPSNIFISNDGVVKLLDFGIAKLMNPQPFEPELTTTQHRIGTPAVMAPEQITNDDVDQRTDVYSMGCVIYRVLTGEYPFKGTSLYELEAKHLMTAPTPPSKLAPVSAEIDAVVLRCLAKKPAERFPSMEALVAELARAVTTFDENTTDVRVENKSSEFDAVTTAQPGSSPAIAGLAPDDKTPALIGFAPHDRTPRDVTPREHAPANTGRTPRVQIAPAAQYPLVGELMRAMPQEAAEKRAAPSPSAASSATPERRESRWPYAVAFALVLASGTALAVREWQVRNAQPPPAAAQPPVVEVKSPVPTPASPVAAPPPEAKALTQETRTPETLPAPEPTPEAQQARAPELTQETRTPEPTQETRTPSERSKRKSARLTVDKRDASAESHKAAVANTTPDAAPAKSEPTKSAEPAKPVEPTPARAKDSPFLPDRIDSPLLPERPKTP